MQFRITSLAIVIVVLGLRGIAQSTYHWSQCKQRVLDIQTGKLTLGSIDNETLDEYLYHGEVVGLDTSFPRDEYLAVTYEGCLAICDNPIALYEPQTALSLASNWIFPLAILLNLPWESLHTGRLSHTLLTALNWLGSPQTTLTATTFNIHQLRRAYLRARVGDSDVLYLYSAGYYVLSCINQFDGITLTDPDAGKMRIRPAKGLEVMMYGIFRPLAGDVDRDLDVRLTKKLVIVLAFQLRMFRRRGVIPTLANLAFFLLAFIFSVILAFGEMGDENTPFSLTFGLFATWLPVLVVFCIVDRNPVSTDRTAVLISRWFYNVNAVKTWAARNETDPSLICWWPVGDEIPECFRVRNFVGQGRELGYCGLLHAGLESSESVRSRFQMGTNRLNITDEISHEVAKTLGGAKPTPWYIAAFTSLLLIWTAVLSALTVSYYAPTVGLHCRPLTYLLFGVFSSVSWVIQFLKRPPRWLVWISRSFNGLAVLTLVVAIVIQVTGITSNCSCRSSAVNLGYAGAYLDFEGFTFYRKNFNVDPFWIGATVVGGTIPAITLVVTVFWWISCKSLWRADENEAGLYVCEDVEDCVDTRWLQ